MASVLVTQSSRRSGALRIPGQTGWRLCPEAKSFALLLSPSKHEALSRDRHDLLGGKRMISDRTEGAR